MQDAVLIRSSEQKHQQNRFIKFKQQQQTLSVSYLPPYYVSILFSSDNKVTSEKITPAVAPWMNICMQKNSSIKHKQEKVNCRSVIFTTPLLLDLVISRQHSHFHKNLHQPLRQRQIIQCPVLVIHWYGIIFIQIQKYRTSNNYKLFLLTIWCFGRYCLRIFRRLHHRHIYQKYQLIRKEVPV